MDDALQAAAPRMCDEIIAMLPEWADFDHSHDPDNAGYEEMRQRLVGRLSVAVEGLNAGDCAVLTRALSLMTSVGVVLRHDFASFTVSEAQQIVQNDCPLPA